MSTYKVDGMTCGGCVSALQRAFTAAGIAVEVSLKQTVGSVTTEAPKAAVKRVVEEAGFDMGHEAG